MEIAHQSGLWNTKFIHKYDYKLYEKETLLYIESIQNVEEEEQKK